MVQSKSGRIALYVLTFVGSAVLGNALYNWYQSTTPPATAAREMENKLRPDFALPDLDGVVHTASEWNGKVLVVNFWATWCPPCQREIPTFIRLQETYRDEGLQFVGIAIDNPAKVRDYIDTLGIIYPTLVGDDPAITVAKQFGNRFGELPYTVFVDRNGRIAKVVRGEVSGADAENQIKALL